MQYVHIITVIVMKLHQYIKLSISHLQILTFQSYYSIGLYRSGFRLIFVSLSYPIKLVPVNLNLYKSLQCGTKNEHST